MTAKLIIILMLFAASTATSQKVGSQTTPPVTLIKPNHVTEYYNTIQGAIAAGSSGDNIHVNAGTYDETITFKNGVNLSGDGKVYITSTSTTSAAAFTDGAVAETLTVSGINFRRIRSNGRAFRLNSASSYFRFQDVTVTADSSDAILNNGKIEGIGEYGIKGIARYGGGIGIYNLNSILLNGYGESASGLGIFNSGSTVYNSFGKSTSSSDPGFYNADSSIAYKCRGESQNGPGFKNQGHAESCEGLATTSGGGFNNTSAVALIPLRKFAVAINCVGTSRGSVGTSNVGFNCGSGGNPSGVDSARAYGCRGFAMGAGDGEGYNAYQYTYNEDCSGYSETVGGYETYGSFSVRCGGTANNRGQTVNAHFGMSAFNASIFGGADIGSTLINCSVYSQEGMALAVFGKRNRIIGGTFVSDWDTTDPASPGSGGNAITLAAGADSCVIHDVTLFTKNPNAYSILGFVSAFISDIHGNTNIQPTLTILDDGSVTEPFVRTPQYRVVAPNIPPSSYLSPGKAGKILHTNEGIYFCDRDNHWIFVEMRERVDYTDSMIVWLRSTDVTREHDAALTQPFMLNGDSVYYMYNLAHTPNTTWMFIRERLDSLALYRTNIVNGRPAIQFFQSTLAPYGSDGSSEDDSLAFTDVTVMGVVKIDSGAAILFGNNVSNNLISVDADSNKLVVNDGTTRTSSSTLGVSVKNNWSIVEWKATGGVLTFKQNGVSYGTASIGGAINLRRMNWDGLFRGYLAEARIYTRAISNSVETIAINALATRYGIDIVSTVSSDSIHARAITTSGNLTVGGTVSIDSLLHLKPYTGTPSAPSSGGYFYTHSGGGVAPDTLFWIDSQTTIKQIAP